MYYTAKITREGKHWLAEFVDADGCQTFADSEAKLRAAAKEALEGWLEAHLVSGQSPPRPRSVKPKPRLRTVPPPKHIEWSVSVDPRLAMVLQLRWAREEQGLSQAALARRVGGGVSQQQIAKLENPDGNPTLKTIAAVSRALGLELDVSLTRVG